MGVENKDSCSQRDSAEREGYVRAHRSFRRIWKERDSAQPELLEEILEKGNLNSCLLYTSHYNDGPAAVRQARGAETNKQVERMTSMMVWMTYGWIIAAGVFLRAAGWM